MPKKRKPNVPRKFKWIPYFLHNKLLNLNTKCHMLIVGITQSGKSYILGWLIEYLYPTKKYKFFILNAYNKSMLAEAVNLNFPNRHGLVNGKPLKGDRKKIKEWNDGIRNPENRVRAKKIKIKIYVPLTRNLPDKLPPQFAPFTIPTNDLDEDCIQTLYGDKPTSRIYSIYDNQIKPKKLTFPEVFFELKKKKAQTSFSSVKDLLDTETAGKTIDGFLDRLTIFEKYGILSHPDNPNCLKKQLKQDINDKETVSVLYTGNLQGNKQVWFFTVVCFIKTIQDLLDEDIPPHKIAMVMDEAHELLTKEDAGAKNPVYTGLQRLLNRLLAAGRHKSLEFWIAVQSPAFLQDKAFKNILATIVTHMTDKKDIEWVCDKLKIWSSHDIHYALHKIGILRRKKIYRFLMLDDSFSIQDKGTDDPLDVGFQLPHPRTNFYHKEIKTEGGMIDTYKVPIEKNYKILYEKAKKEGNNEIVDVKRLKEQLMQEEREKMREFKARKQEEQRKKTEEHEKTEREREELPQGIAEKRRELEKEAEAELQPLKEAYAKEENANKKAETLKRIEKWEKWKTNETEIARRLGVSRGKVQRNWAKSEQYMRESV